MNNKIVKYFNSFEPKTMTPNIKIFWKSARGIYIWDQNNKRYIDFTSSIFVTNIGHVNQNLYK